MNTTQCSEIAKIQVPWADQIFQYCPVHANQLVMLGKAIGLQIKPKLIPSTVIVNCESHEICTPEEKEYNAQFNPVLTMEVCEVCGERLTDCVCD